MTSRYRSPTSAGTPRRPRSVPWLSRPLISFHLVLAITAALTVLGLVMVLSASSVEAYLSDGSAYSLFFQQLLGVLLGAAAFYLALRAPVRLVRRVSFAAFALSIVMLVLVLVPGIGTQIQGSRRWFSIAGISFQPSEFAKIALVIWGAHLLALRSHRYDWRGRVRDVLLPLLPGAGLMCVLVVLQPNLSTTITLGIILLALLWFSGFDKLLFGGLLLGCLAAAVLLTFTAGYRADRIKSLFNPGSDPQGLGYQSMQAKLALADGGLTGQGLGQSESKWSYLPNAYNDFIFAIVGEELGLIGCVTVLALFGSLAFVGMRIAMRSVDPFLRLLAAVSTTWICGQAVINIGYVEGLLPVTGLQLPLISYGGTSTTLTLLMFGLLANAARHEPAAIASVHARQYARGLAFLRLPLPVPYGDADRRRPASGKRRSHAPKPRQNARGPDDPSGRRGAGGRQPRTRGEYR